MTLANQLTMLRILLALATFVALIQDSPRLHAAALILFLSAMITDWVDGWIARNWQQTSPFGKVADPIADKILVLGAFLALTKHRDLAIPLWGVFLIFAREMIIGGIRTLAMIQQQKLLAAEAWGKWKMAIQSACLILLIAIQAAKGYWAEAPAWVWALPYPLTLISVVATWVSGVLYLRQHKKLIESSWS